MTSMRGVPSRLGGGLLRVELDDELLADGHVDVRPLRQVPDRDLAAAVAGFQPADDRSVEDVEVVADDDHLHGLLAERDDLAGTDAVAGDVDPLAVDLDEAVVHELARLGPGGGPAGAVHDVVEAQLEQPQQVLTGDAREAGGLLVGPAELPLEHAVDVLGLLLLLQLDEVLAATRPAAGAAVGARWVRTALERLAALVVLEDVRAEAPGELDLRSGVARHRQTLRRFGGRQPL